MSHSSDCPCNDCVFSRDLKAFVDLRAIQEMGGLTWKDIAGDAPLPKRGPVIQRTEKEQVDHESILKREALLFGELAFGPPKKRGRKKKHTPKGLIELLRGFEAIQASYPEKSEKEAIEQYLENEYKKRGKRTSRVIETETQAAIKTVQNLLAEARKLLRKYHP